VALGKFKIKDLYQITEIAIYKQNSQGKFELEKLRDFEFDDACIQFEFNNLNSRELFFFTREEVFKWDYLDEAKDKELYYKFSNALGAEPKFGVFNSDQSKFIITSSEDILYVDKNKSIEIDLDDREDISSIQNIIADKDKFYCLANKKEQRLGFYLFSVDMQNPHNESEYLIKWTNKLDIGNCDMHIMKEKDKNTGDLSSKIVVSFKSIGINTFNVFVIDLQDKLIKYWHEGYQLWESPVKGFLLNTNDFLILSKDGINVLALGEKEGRQIKDKDGLARFIHSLGSINYIKIEPTNHLLFACQFYEDR
jgi:hypothetical protein